MKDPNTKKYEDALNPFQKAIEGFINKLISRLNKLTTKTVPFSNNTEIITLSDNTIYQYTGTEGINELIIKYPDGDFISTILFSTNTYGKIQITFPVNTKFVGRRKLEFFNQEHWELNIHNGRVAASQIFEN